MNSVQMGGGVLAVVLIKRRSALGRQYRGGGLVSEVGVFSVFGLKKKPF